MAVPEIIGIAKGGRAGSAGSVTVTPPPGATGYLAFVGKGSGSTLPIAPAGWTFIRGYRDDGTENEDYHFGIYAASTSVGSTWQWPGTSPLNIMIIGYDMLPVITTGVINIGVRDSPSMTISEAGLVTRTYFSDYKLYDGMLGYPSNAPLWQDKIHTDSGDGTWGQTVAVAHSIAAGPGSVPATRWSADLDADITGTFLITADEGEPGEPEPPTDDYADAVLADSPYQWFRFQEPSGSSALDSSGNTRHGSLIGAPSRGAGPVDQAIMLNGSTQAVDGNMTALGSSIAAASLELMISTTDTRQKRFWAGYSAGSPPRFAIVQNDLAINAQQLHLEYRSSTNVTRHHIFDIAGANLWNGDWHHVVFVTEFASNRAHLYIDGNYWGATTSENDTGTFAAWGIPPYFGTRNNNGTPDAQALTASMAEIAWYDHQLSLERVAAHYAALGIGGGDPDPDPPAEITFEAAGSTAMTPATLDWSFTPDAGTLADDIFVVQVYTQDNDSTLTAPANTLATPELNFAGPGTGDRYSVLIWRAPTDAPGPVALTISTAARGVVSWMRFRGVSITQPVDGFGLGPIANGEGAWDVQAPSILTTGPSRYVLAGWTADGGGSVASVTGPSGWWATINGTPTQRPAVGALKGIQPVAGATGQSGVWTISPSNIWDGSRLTWQMALRPRIEDDDDLGGLPPSGPVPALVQTDFPPSSTPGVHKDIVDDPAIWVNPDDPTQSVILGSNKDGAMGGIHLYDLSGSQISFAANGETNNVDLRDLRGVAGWDDRVLVVGSNRLTHSIDLMWLDRTTRTLSMAGNIPLGWNRPYGIGLYVSPVNGDVHVMVCETGTHANGSKLEQFKLTRSGSTASGTLVRSMTTITQCEGIVGDDKNGYFFVGEEDVALMRFDAESTDPNEVPYVVDVAGGDHLVDDIEGLAIAYDRADGEDYLIASSQGSSTFVVYDLDPPHNYRKTFWVQGPGANNVADTDGIEITRADLGALWPNGVFVSHDNHPLGSNVSNFKLVDAGLILGTYDDEPEPPTPVMTAALLETPTGRWANPATRVMWQHDGTFGAVLPTTLGHYIVPDVSDFNNFGPLVRANQDTRVDVRYHDGWLGVLAGRVSPGTTLFYSFDVTNNYTPIVSAAGVSISTSGVDNLDTTPPVLHRADNGHLWAAVMSLNNVWLSRSTDGGASWSSASAIGTTMDEGKVNFASVGSTLVLIATANDGAGRQVWTRQEEDASSVNQGWSPETIPTLPSGVVSDDHLSVTVASDGTLYAASKTTGATTGSHPLIYLLVRTPAGVWSSHTVETGPDTGTGRFTRPSIALHGNGTAAVYYGNIGDKSSIWYRTFDGAELSSRQVSLADGGDYSDSAQVPRYVEGGMYPILVHNRSNGSIAIVLHDIGDPPTELPFGFLGTTEILAAYLGDNEITALHGS